MHYKKIIIILGILIILGLIFVFGLNQYVISSTKKNIKRNFNETDFDAILILGAAVWGDAPSPMLQDRLDAGLDLYKQGVSKKIIVSGDHGKKSYDEVNTMKQYLIDEGVKSEDIFMDHAGFSTYDSIYRAKYVFGVKKVVLISQKYHLYRSVYIAKHLGIEAYGYEKDMPAYSNQFNRELREILARDKDVVKCIFKPASKYVGETIDIKGSGDVTNDK